MQQQQQSYRLPAAGQGSFPPNPQPVIRPQVNNGGVRQVINPNQPPLIRAGTQQPTSNQPIRPPIVQQQQQFRPPPPPQQQQFQRPPYQVPLDQQQHQQQQFRPQQPPVNIQRQPVPEQKFIRNPLPPQNQNMMAEMNRERTFTTSHEGSIQGSMDDDDDVVIGRMVTPQARPNINQKPIDNYEQRPNVLQQQQQPPMPQQRPVQQPMQQPMMQRRESVQSIPSRPPSGMGSNNSQSPEPRVSPMPPQNMMPSNIQPHQQNRIDNNRNVPSELNRQSPSNYDYARDQVDHNEKERVQRAMNQSSNIVPTQQQRRTSIFAMEDPMQRQKVIQQPPPPQPQFRPAPVPQNEGYTKTTPEPKITQPEHFTQQPQHQQQQRQQNLQDNKPNPSVLKQQEQKRTVVDAKPVDIQNLKNSVRLDLSKSENIKSSKDKSPSKKNLLLAHISST